MGSPHWQKKHSDLSVRGGGVKREGRDCYFSQPKLKHNKKNGVKGIKLLKAGFQSGRWTSIWTPEGRFNPSSQFLDEKTWPKKDTQRASFK